MWMCSKLQQGLTLVELVISMVIVTIALGGVLLVMNYTTTHSADPMVKHQAIAIGEAYLEEILLQEYEDPDGAGSDESSEGRSTYDDVDDYAAIDGKPKDQSGDALPGLDEYRVTVTVTDVNDELGLSGDEVPAKRVAVQVVYPGEVDITLTGYRTKY